MDLQTNSNPATDRSASPVADELLSASRQEGKTLLQTMGVPLQGYSHTEVASIRAKFGRNIVSHEKPDSLYKRLLSAFVNPFTVVLFVLALVSLFTDVIMATDKNPRSVILICSMVLMSGMLRFIQESRSNKAAQKLKAMVHTTAMV